MRMKTLAIASLLLVAGCSVGEQLREVIVTEDPVTGKTPLETVSENAPKVATDPYDFQAWGEILGAAAAVGVGLFAGKKVKDRIAQKKAAQGKQ